MYQKTMMNYLEPDERFASSELKPICSHEQGIHGSIGGDAVTVQNNIMDLEKMMNH